MLFELVALIELKSKVKTIKLNVNAAVFETKLVEGGIALF